MLVVQKDGVISHVRAIRLNALILEAAIRIPSECWDLSRKKRTHLPGFWQSEPTTKKIAAEEEQFNNQNGIWLFVTQMLANGKLYVAIISHIFGKYICGSVRAVNDWIVLQSLSLTGLFNRSDPFNILKSVNDSEVIKSFTISHPSCAQSTVDNAFSGLKSSNFDL